MNKTLPILLSALWLLGGCGPSTPPPPPPPAPPERLVSLAPNITEIVCALGLEHRLVGVTDFCTYPASVRTRPRIGGFGQVNYEALVAARPDLVLLHREATPEQARIEELGFPCLPTDSGSIEEILASIRSIGNACGVGARADALIQARRDRIEAIRRAAGTKTDPPRVLLLFGGEATGPMLAFGPASLHHELLELAGGQNVVSGSLPYATLSPEAVIDLNPDLILVLAPELNSAADYTRDWRALYSVAAIRNHRVHVLCDDYTCIPGPRFIAILETFHRLLRKPE